MIYTALLAGASGLVGSQVLQRLAADPDCRAVHALGRRPLSSGYPKVSQHTWDFDRLAEVRPFPAADVVFCCLGTTIKAAGSRAAFSKVDFTYAHEVARLALAAGAKQFLLISALGADPESRIFYNRVKGKVEEAVRALPYHGIHIFRPSLLLGERREFRLGERVATVLTPLFTWALVGPLRKYRPIRAAAVARAMVRVGKEGRAGVQVYESDEIERLSR